MKSEASHTLTITFNRMEAEKIVREVASTGIRADCDAIDELFCHIERTFFA